jgi:hypothetical protein
VPEKTILQQPVTLAEVSRVSYILYPTGTALDLDVLYQPVDETGTPVGEKRTMGGAKTGPEAQQIRDWLNSTVIIEINEHEGTA